MSPPIKTSAAAVFMASILVFAAPIAHAESEPLLEDPFGIIGPAATPVGGQTTTLGLNFTRSRHKTNRDLYNGSVEAEAGLVRGLDLRFSQNLEYGPAAPYPRDEAARLWGGYTQMGLRWQLTEEDGWRPALGVFGALQTSYGETSRPSENGQILALLSKTIIEGPRPLAFLLNAGWSELFNPEPRERAGRYQAAMALAQSVAQNTSLGLTYAVDQQDRGQNDKNTITAGIWHRLGDSGPILSAGAGAGIGDDSPRFLVFAQAKWLFGAAAGH